MQLISGPQLVLIFSLLSYVFYSVLILTIAFASLGGLHGDMTQTFILERPEQPPAAIPFTSWSYCPCPFTWKYQESPNWITWVP